MAKSKVMGVEGKVCVEETQVKQALRMSKAEEALKSNGLTGVEELETQNALRNEGVRLSQEPLST